MEDWLYWIYEYGKVFLGYLFIMLIWPSAVFRKYLKGKSMTFRLGFCVCGQMVIMNTVVLMLGLFHILNVWVLRLVFLGALVWSFREQLVFSKERRKRFRYLITGTYGVRHFWLRCRQGLKALWVKAWKVIWSFYRVHFLEYTILGLLIIYGVIYFSYGVFLDHSYAFSDAYVHHSWVYELAQGKPFSSGIYPEGMHCMMYGLHALFGIPIYSCMLFVPGVNVIFILLGIYCMMKELFRWRYSALFALTIFLTIDMSGRYLIISMARVQCALPQEFAFPAIYFCIAFLLRYLNNRRFVMRKGKESKGCWDENLVVFALAVASTILVHFYATFMAVFLCIAIGICWFRKIFSRERFVPLLTAAFCGLLIAATPMVAGVATGIPLQGSLYWGLSLLNIGTDKEEAPEEDTQEESTEATQGGPAVARDSEGIFSDSRDVILLASTAEVVMQEDGYRYELTVGEKLCPPGTGGLAEQVIDKLAGVYEGIKGTVQKVYEKCYLLMYGESRAIWLAGITVAVFAFWIVYRLIVWLLRLVTGNRYQKNRYDTYPIVALASIIYAITHSMGDLGLPVLVEGTRTGFTNHLLAVMVVTLVLDLFFDGIQMAMNKIGATLVPPFLSVCTICTLLLVIVGTDSYHGYLYSELTRYDAAVNVTNHIIEQLPKDSYTIISPTDELYQVIQYGRHEELADFCIKKEGEELYILPTEYVFFFVEKRPLYYAQYHFWDGPAWLATDKYQYQYGAFSLWPEYRHGEISKEAAGKEMIEFNKPSDVYLSLESRTILQSKAYEWCERFNELYPYELRTYYEDDYFVCYYWKQNPQHFYDLVIE